MTVRTDIAVVTVSGQIRSLVQRPTQRRSATPGAEVRYLDRDLLEAALAAAGGDYARLHIEDDNTIVVRNNPREVWSYSVPRARPLMS